jgi:DNA-directed RNA polymerase alpha subunit
MTTITKRTRRALEAGYARKDPIQDLELIGVELRIINALERHRIFTLDQLLSKTQEQILAIPNISKKQFKKLIAGLQQYERLDRIRQREIWSKRRNFAAGPPESC